MAEIEGVRPWLDRAADFLRTQLQWFATQVVPGATAHVVIPADPTQVDWQDPPRYRFEALANLTGPPDPHRIDRAANALHASGWTVQVLRDPHFPTVVTVRGERESYVLQARFEEGYPGIVLLGETPNIPLYKEEPLPPAPPSVTPETLSDDAVLCYECDGRGRCPTCRGLGWTKGGPTGRHRCRTCLGSRFCPICGGAGELRITELSEIDRARYPQIP
ncbi:hypothetical protein [Nocardia sp. XZ_19_385]|uniref:hypothetical protein n=1 Tax=Nocardia sp. XZ_19_385 TaxID=2769488 RepID=UPI00188EB313|nr:hypothetical protein [Nocardia sp. XZ_19_385]